MSVTPQTNTSLEELASALLKRDNFVVAGHVSPDGDCIGSQLALVEALHSLGKHAVGVLAKDEPVDERLNFLPGVKDLLPAAKYRGPANTFIAVDVPVRSRLNAAAGHLLDACEYTVTLDHHAADERMTQVAYIDPQQASSTLLVWRLVGLMGASYTPSVAQCCYTGLVADTGRFQYQNTNASALIAAAAMLQAGADAAAVSRELFQSRSLASKQLEALAIQRMIFGAEKSFALSWLTKRDFCDVHATRSDAEPVIDALRSLRGVRVACMLREQDRSVRGSFRAKDDTDVGRLAAQLGGGGHKAAAGFTLSGTLDQAVLRIREMLEQTLEAAGEHKA